MPTSSDGRRTSDRVHDVLRGEILGGALPPGAAVPSERVLAEQLGVNRQSVREAVKRLEQAGLVRMRHGGATRVLDWRDSGGLEVLADLARGEAVPPADLAQSIIEMRASIGIDAARLCVARADAPTREAVRDRAEAAAELVGGPAVELEERYAAMWQTVVAGSGNVAYRLAFNTLLRALPSQPEIADIVRPADAAAIRAFGAAVAAGDQDAAVRYAVLLLSP
jgi:DNA-binding FadR family transcriptional regulator